MESATKQKRTERKKQLRHQREEETSREAPALRHWRATAATRESRRIDGDSHHGEERLGQQVGIFHEITV